MTLQSKAVIFALLAGTASLPALAAERQGPLVLAQATSPTAEAAKVWPSVQDTTDIAVLEAFRQRYADTFFAKLAADRIAALRQKAGTEQKPADTMPAPSSPTVTSAPAAPTPTTIKPAATGGGEMTPCDALAASPVDPSRRGPGVDSDKIDPTRAIPACEAEVARNPKDGRAIFQLSRAYYSAKRLPDYFARSMASAEVGYPAGMNSVGVAFWFGEGTPRNTSDARYWFRKAAEAGYATSYGNVAVTYSEGADQNPAEALKWYRLGAEKGDVASMSQVGDILLKATGADQDYEGAMQFYRKAADAGDSYSIAQLGYMYENGMGTAPDYAEAMQWYRKAIKLGNTYAMMQAAGLYEKGRGVAQDNSEALSLIQSAADGGNVRAMVRLGNILFAAGRQADALPWIRRAAEKENPEALYRLGNFYSQGYGGLKRDTKQATALYRKAADAGNGSAMLLVGIEYIQGKTVKRNYTTGYDWLVKATNAGETDAYYAIGLLYEYGLGRKRDYKVAAANYQKAVDNNNRPAMRSLAGLYQRGLGVKKDLAMAKRLKDKAGPP